MNTRLMKETRELLPVFTGTLLLIVVPCLIWGAHAEPFAVVACGVGCAVLAGCSIGNEFQHRTLSLLLSQPVARSVLWRDKMLVLGAGILTCLAALFLCQRAYCPVPDREAQATLALVALCAFCGAPYGTIVSRQTMAGICSTAAGPVSLLGVYALMNWWLFNHRVIQLSDAVILLVPYCAVVFWRGNSRFKRLEVIDSPVRELGLPAGLEAFLARLLTKASSRFRGPFASLLKKEFRLQQASFLLAGGFFLIAVIGFCLIPLYADLGQGILAADFSVVVLILPLVAGAIAVAEEKGWDLAEWQRTLPPSARQQWLAKMLATLTTSLALGLLLPAAIFLAGEPLLFPRGSRVAFPTAYGLAACVLGQLLVTSVAVYAASFCKSTMRAILVAVGILVATFGALFQTAWWLSGMFAPALSVHYDQFSRMPPALHLVLPLMLLLMLCLTQWFAWTNFRRFGPPVRRLVIQLLVLLIAVGLVSVPLAALIHPVWQEVHSTR